MTRLLRRRTVPSPAAGRSHPGITNSTSPKSEGSQKPSISLALAILVLSPEA